MRIPQKAILGLSLAIILLSSGKALAADVVFRTPFVTRAEAVMLLLQARVRTVPAPSDGTRFADVRPGSWYERYIVAGARLGIIQADTARKMRPDDPVTRAEFLSMAVNAFDIDASLYASTYADVPPDLWYAPVAGVAQRYRLFPKDADQQRLRGNAMMTHGEMAYAVRIIADADAAMRSDRTMQPAASWYQTISTSVQRMMFMHTAAPAPRPATTLLKPTVVLLPRAAPPGSTPEEIPGLRLNVLTLVNEIRRNAELPELSVNPALEGSAQRYAEEMYRDNFFGHESPTGETLETRMRQSGYYNPLFNPNCLCIERYLLGENLARGQKSATEVVSHWMGSPSHRQAILNASFTDTGIGVKAGIWVMHFGGKQN